MTNWVAKHLMMGGVVACALCSVRAGAQVYDEHKSGADAATVPVDERDPDRQRELIMASFAECVVESASAENLARAFVAIDPMTDQASEAGKAVTDPECLPKVGQSKIVYELRFKPFLFRYELLGALYRRNFRTEPDPSIRDLPVSDYAGEFVGGKVPPGLLALRQFGDCVARSAPQASHRLAMSRLYSDEEDQAISGVMPYLEACMPPGSSVGFTRGTLRGTISEALLRLREGSEGSAG